LLSGYITVEGSKIYYEEYGKGVPLLFLEGLGYSTWMWYKQVDELAEGYRCILIDNRGVGKSERLSGPYTIDFYARDAIAVLEELGVRSTFLVGVSMGGFIAQSIASKMKERVQGMVLISTSCGGRISLPMPTETWKELNRNIEGEDYAGRIERVMKLALTDSFPYMNAEEFQRIIKLRLIEPQDREQWLFQAMSSVNFDACDSDSKLEAPALIMAGMKDKVMPWLNSLYLFKVIPNASLVLFSQQNHLLFIEEYKKVNEKIKSFVSDVTKGSFFPRIELL
jgi:pimeloyl-ACP methyl ester carboxylesterase